MKNYIHGEQIRDCQRYGQEKVDVGIKRQHNTPCGDGNVLYLGCIEINILYV